MKNMNYFLIFALMTSSVSLGMDWQVRPDTPGRVVNNQIVEGQQTSQGIPLVNTPVSSPSQTLNQTTFSPEMHAPIQDFLNSILLRQEKNEKRSKKKSKKIRRHKSLSNFEKFRQELRKGMWR